MVLIAICIPCKSPWTKNNKNPIQLYLLPIWTPFTWISDCILAPKKTTKWLKNSNREIHFIEDLSFRDFFFFFLGGGGVVCGTMFEYYCMIHWQEIQFPVSTCKQGIGHGGLPKCRHKSDYACAILEIDHIIDACRSTLESKERIWSAALVLLHSFNIYRCIPMKVFE